jgi:hypothetical protein
MSYIWWHGVYIFLSFEITTKWFKYVDGDRHSIKDFIITKKWLVEHDVDNK